MRIFLIISGILLLSSCIKEPVLPLGELNEKPSYFVECYLIPNEIYKLSATKLQPINEDYILDYSLDFEVKVGELDLIQGLYRDEKGFYIYNYGHWKKFMPGKSPSVQLMIIPPVGDTISASTTIPEQVIIDAVLDKNQELSVMFKLDRNPQHNYYICKVANYLNDSVQNETKYFDLSQKAPNTETRIKMPIANKDFDSISTVLMRLTDENFKYQLSLKDAQNANNDNLVQPSPLKGNLSNSTGIFTCFTADTVLLQ